jgi:hypothetical protein
MQAANSYRKIMHRQAIQCMAQPDKELLVISRMVDHHHGVRRVANSAQAIVPPGVCQRRLIQLQACPHTFRPRAGIPPPAPRSVPQSARQPPASRSASIGGLKPNSWPDEIRRSGFNVKYLFRILLTSIGKAKLGGLGRWFDQRTDKFSNFFESFFCHCAFRPQGWQGV